MNQKNEGEKEGAKMKIQKVKKQKENKIKRCKEGKKDGVVTQKNRFTSWISKDNEQKVEKHGNCNTSKFFMERQSKSNKDAVGNICAFLLLFFIYETNPFLLNTWVW